MGADWNTTTPEELWNELRSLSPMHAGMSYERLENERGLQWPCPSLDHPGTVYLHSWLWEDDLDGRDPAPFSITNHEGPKEQLTDEFPLRLTTGRTLDSFNTGVQSSGYESPIRSGSHLEISAVDAVDLGLVNGERVVVSSPRGSVQMNIKIKSDQAAGLAFSTFHFPELVDLNVLTNDEWDKRSGTAEFKAASIRIDKLPLGTSHG
tara:strand:- start:337 stop:957 length:621 start_codon:yes stop_codon:yes gene_type:complete